MSVPYEFSPTDDFLYTLELFSIDMFPVYSPALISANSPLNQPADLEHHLLLQIPSINNEPRVVKKLIRRLISTS